MSGALASGYEAFVRPAVSRLVPKAAAKAARQLHPQRVQRWLLSDINPCLWPLASMADLAKASRATRSPDNVFLAAEAWAAATTSAWLDLYRDLRDANVERLFFRTYAPLSILGTSNEAAPDRSAFDPAASPAIQAALADIEEGSRMDGLVRLSLLLATAGTGVRRLSAMKSARELVGQDVGLLDLSADAAQAIIRRQSFAIEYEPERALATLPRLLATPDDRSAAIDLLNQIEARLDGNERQRALLVEIRSLLEPSRAGPMKAPSAELGPDVARRPSPSTRKSA